MMMKVEKQTELVWEPQQLEPGQDGLIVIGQLGQSLDGQIATATGHSKYINGQGGLAHLHRLRAWADVVVVGVGTVVADNPKLTVRLVKGRDPDRVVIDPNARTPSEAGCLQDAPVQRVVLTRVDAEPQDWPPGVQQMSIQTETGEQRLPPQQVREWLAKQGWQRVLIEGGASTLAGFLSAGCLDYLHLITSPVLLGPGTAGVQGVSVTDLSLAPRFRVQPFALGDDLLMVCAFG